MKILVIGGSYFLGKTFVELAREMHQIYIVNRGNSPLFYEDVVEYVADRHDVSKLQLLSEEEFDVIVDFCAYSAGDIRLICENIKVVKQYIYISTCDVYKRGTNMVLDENSPLEDRIYDGTAGAYISGKVALEKELLECALEYNFKYTSLRPAFIYGPHNYAPRESMYFEWILNAGQIIHPVDATGEFYMVFVLDVARAICFLCGNTSAYNESFNVCCDEPVNYEEFANVLELALERSFERLELSVSDVLNKNIPLPFPLTKEESEYYSNNKLKQLGFAFSDFVSGMKVTADFYMN